MDAEKTLNGDEREELYKQYGEAQVVQEPETTPEEVDAPEEAAEKPEEAPEEVKTEDFKAEPAPEEAEAPPEAENQVKEDEKTVSLKALHEERAKRKALNQEVSELKSQVQQLLNDNMSLMQKEPEDGDELATRKEIYELKRENEALRKQFEQYGTQQQEELQRRQFEELQKRIADTHKKLSDQGFPGFQEVGQHIIAQKLIRMDAEDRAMYDTPDGWMELYRQEFPKLRQQFIAQAKKESFDAKKAQKKEAALAGTAGRGEKPTPEKKEWSYQDYVKMRSEKGLS